MRKEKAIVAQVKITKAGQVKHFQAKLPRNAVRIIGIEIGGRIIKIEKVPGNAYEVLEKLKQNDRKKEEAKQDTTQKEQGKLKETKQ